MTAVENADQPRLVDIKFAARYLGGLSIWTIRAFIANGQLRAVRLPSVRHPHENGRRLLFDRRDLDAFIDARRHA